MDIITASNLIYKYPTAKENAVDGVSFSVKDGEFCAIVGHNGSGKSTVARLLNGLLRAESGTLTVGGITPQSDEDFYSIRKMCGMVFQNPDNQLVATVVEEDVAFGLENLSVAPNEIRKRVDEALATVGMTEYAAHQPHMLSGGQKQRVAIAGVLAMKPKVIIFDESTAMLDPAGRKTILDMAIKLNREEGITILWITHFMEEAARAQRILAMDKGRVRLEGEPREFFTHTEEIRAMGLDVPEMTRLSLLLREKGMALPETVLTVEEMAVAVCRSK